MDFANPAINIQALPAVEKAKLQPVQPSFKKVLRIEWYFTTAFLFVLAAATFFLFTSIYPFIASIAALIISSFHLLINTKGFDFLAYAVRDKDVIHQKGWIVRRTKICPFNRIQNCSVQSGPLERRYGLATLIIYTAGTDGADLRISGLQQEEAEKLRHFILDKIQTETYEAA